MYDISDYARTYDATTTSLDMAETADLMGMMAGVGAISYVISLAIAIFSIVTMWKVFAKAGQPGWAALIPIYNLVVLFRVARLNEKWALLLLLFFIPVVNYIAILVLTIMLYVKLAKAFGKSGGFAVGLLLLNPIFMAILAFSDAEYQGV